MKKYTHQSLANSILTAREIGDPDAVFYSAADLAADVLPVLRAMEWDTETSDGSGGTVLVCSLCVRTRSNGHAPDCRLAVLIQELSQP